MQCLREAAAALCSAVQHSGGAWTACRLGTCCWPRDALLHAAPRVLRV